jgi:hypothetical protein
LQINIRPSKIINIINLDYNGYYMPEIVKLSTLFSAEFPKIKWETPDKTRIRVKFI